MEAPVESPKQPSHVELMRDPLVRSYIRTFIAAQLNQYAPSIAVGVLGVISYLIAEFAGYHASSPILIALTGVALGLGRLLRQYLTAAAIVRALRDAASWIQRGGPPADGPPPLAPGPDVVPRGY